MLKDFKNKFTFAAVEKMADFLLTLDVDAAKKDGMDRLPNEKEGSILKAELPAAEPVRVAKGD
jgi:hypothetical protein